MYVKVYVELHVGWLTREHKVLYCKARQCNAIHWYFGICYYRAGAVGNLCMICLVGDACKMMQHIVHIHV